MLPSHLRAMRDIESCRTEVQGGHVYLCPHCERKRYSYHSCKNRHCPKCQNEAAQEWLDRQQDLRLPVPYFLVTFTLPEELREIARRNQKTIYNLLFRSSSAAAQKLAMDARFVGGRIGMIGVLHTWARDLSYHPHVHYLVPGGGFNEAEGIWLPGRADFLFPVKALSRLFRAKIRDGLKQTDLFGKVPQTSWRREWVVHCQPVGSGEAALMYLAPYIFRVALSNRRICNLFDGKVTYSFKENGTGRLCFRTMGAERFIHRFLQHVLPKGFVKVRYYGFFSAGKRDMLEQIRECLGVLTERGNRERRHPENASTMRCPHCGTALRWMQTIEPKVRPPPEGWMEASKY
jgi:hypothetical protein